MGRRKLLSIISSIFIISFFSLFITSAVLAASSINWSETQPGGATNYNWLTVSISDNGQTLLAGATSGKLYKSTNGGSSWTETQPAGNTNANWESSAMSANGQTMVAAAYSGRLYVSSNGGTNWSEAQPAGNTNQSWETLTMSSYGQTIFAGVYGGRAYLSTNGGTSWAETQPAGNTSQWWYGSSMSSNGQTILAGAINSSRIYLTTNGGVSWSETQPAGNTDGTWYGASVSGNGQTLLAATSGGKVYLSTNAGSSWAATNAAGGANSSWLHTGMSRNGTTMIAADESRLYVSFDSGQNWGETQPIGATTNSWWPVAINSDGTSFIAGIYVGRLYLGSLVLATLTPTPAAVGSSASTSPSANSNSSAPVCGDAAPTNPPNLFQISAKGNTATIYFVPVSGPNNKYYVSYGINTDATGYGTEFDYADRSGVIPYTVNYLFSGTWYLKVRGQNGCMPGGWSQVLSVKVSPFDSIYTASSNSVLGSSANTKDVTRACTDYTVVLGDSLWGIATVHFGNGANYQKIMQQNNLKSFLINPGQKLKIGC